MIVEEYTQYRQNFIEILGELEIMSYGHLGRIDVTKHRIVLEPSKQCPIHSKTYRVGPKAKELEKQEVQRMVAEKATEPARTEWAAPKHFCPEDRGVAQLLRRLSKVECCKRNGLVYITIHGREHRSLMRSSRILNT